MFYIDEDAVCCDALLHLIWEISVLNPAKSRVTFPTFDLVILRF